RATSTACPHPSPTPRSPGRSRSSPWRAACVKLRAVHSLDDLTPLLRFRRSGLSLAHAGKALRSSDGRFDYPITDGVPDLRQPPARLALDLPSREPWDELDAPGPQPTA